MHRFVVAAFYCAVVFLANLTAATFIPLPLFGMISVGTLFFGATFTLRDYAHHHGKRFVYGMITLAALVNVAGALVTDTPIRIILASFVTILLAESADTEVYQRLMSRPWLQRVMGSNALSIPIDTLLFTLLAFAWVMPWPDIAAIVWGDMVVKFAVGLVLALARREAYAPNNRKPA